MASVKKVLMLVENQPAPADRRVWPEALALRDHGFQVTIISPKGVGKHREAHVCIDGIHIYRYRLPTPGNKYIAYFAEYGVALIMTFLLSVKVHFRHGFDVIHAANPPDIFFLIGLFYRLFGKQYVFDQHDLSPEMFQVIYKRRMKLLHKILLLLERWSYRTAHVVITSNASQGRFAQERGGCRPDRVFVVRNGPDLQRLQVPAFEPDLKGGRRFLLAYVGVMAVQDGVEYTLYALDELVHKRGRQDVGLVLMGDGDTGPAMRALAHRLGLDEYVKFTGWTDNRDVMRYLVASDLGLTPDPRNGLNEYCTMIKTMEYMAMGKPVVAFDLAETRWTAQDAALYATPNVIEEFADHIETLLDDEELRRKMGVFARERVEKELHWGISVQNLLRAYQTLFPQDRESQTSEEATLITVAH
jgi:glycosyltransferase involved in cell wall biosynthesis